LIAWEILRGLADCFVTVTDEEALEAVDMLQTVGVETSPSGAAGFAGLVALRGQDLCGFDANSRVLAFVTECRPEGPFGKSAELRTEPVPVPGSVGMD
jgi:diaminopropionate ammonia-lyase